MIPFIDARRMTAISPNNRNNSIYENRSVLATSSARHTDDVIAGAVSGTVSRLFTAPFDCLKIRKQLQSTKNAKYTTMYQSFKTIIQEEGIKGMWKGNISATLLW